MSATSAPLVPPPTQALLASMSTFRRFTVAEYHELIRIGVLTTEDRVELIDGYLVNKMPQNDPHASTVQRLTEDLVRLAPPGWRARTQLPITLADSEPEPDGALVRGDRRTYDRRKPGPADVGVVIEVADTSLRFDRLVKLEDYARAGIPVYWIVNLVDGQVEVYTDPAATPPAYRTRTDFRPGQDVPLVLDGVAVATIPAAELLP
ncbi:MAG: Uma2 family endonuclease [Gemmataceae bacterium]